MKNFRILLTAAMVLLAACNGKEGGPVSRTGVDVDAFDGETVQLDGAAQTFTATVSGEGWEVATSSDDTWIVAWRNEEGRLSVRVTANDMDTSRSSTILIHNNDHTGRLTVVQDYVKYMNFISSENVIEPAAGPVSIPIATNLPTDGVSVGSDADWMSGFAVSGSKLVFTVTANPSTQDSRSGTITVRSGLYVATTKVTQVAMSGYPYVVTVAGLDFGHYPVYELLDQVHGEKVGRICREFLYKTDPISGEELVKGAYTVVYPYYEGKIDYSRGRIWEDGGTVSWKESISVNDRGADHIAWYEAGGQTPGQEMSRPRGATTFRLDALTGDDADDAIRLAAVPMIVVDTREGPENAHGQTSETFEYSVVKVGMQYWQKSNLRTSRFADGTPITTNVDRYTYWQPNVPGNTIDGVTTTHLNPMCLIAGVGSSTRFDDADNESSAAVNARMTYGLIYTYACLVNSVIEFPVGVAASFDRTDRLSPEGWKVPSRNDFQLMLNYLMQSSSTDNEARMEDLMEKIHSERADLTGFSAVGTQQRGPSGGYNTVLYYFSMDYRFVGAQHLVSVLRIRSGNYIPMFDLTVASAVYVRLLKDDTD